MAFETLLGGKAWSELKESDDLRLWRKYILKILDAYKIAFEETVYCFDEDLFDQFRRNIESTKSSISSYTDIDSCIEKLCSHLMEQSFLQMGLIPKRDRKSSYLCRNISSQWNLSSIRTVQYIQTSEQKNKIFLLRAQKIFGVTDINLVYRNYSKSNTDLLFEQWFKESFPDRYHQMNNPRSKD